MKKTNKIITVIIIIALLLLGIGYAAIQNVTLNISGTATANPNQSNFKVMFSGTPQVSDATKVVAAITNDTNATINVSGLTKKGDTVTATYTVQNASSDLSADLSVATTNSNIEYFTLKAELAKTSLKSGEATTLTVTVTLTKTPVTGTVSSTIGIQTVATPVEPGKEGSSGSTNDSSQTPDTVTTLADVTNANIGDYIDLGNNIVGTESTSDDWRILYVEGNTVYAILADYLPNDTGYALKAGLDEYGTYGVYSNTSKEILLNGLTTSTDYWRELANGITGAEVTGTPTVELLMNSYNTKNGTNLDYTTYPIFDIYGDDFDLYVPHTEVVEECYGYRTATPIGEDEYASWYVVNATTQGVDFSLNVLDAHHLDRSGGIRPIVAIPLSTNSTVEGDVWTIIK